MTDDSHSARGLTDYLQQIWKLTKVEAALACAITEGKSLQEISDSTAVSVETLRSRLKKVFQKVGAHSQSSLIRTILTTPAAMLHRQPTSKM